MAGEWTSNNPIHYALNGETYDSLFRKTKLNFDQVFELLNILRSAGAQAGLDATDAMPYQIRINTADNCLYIRDKNNEQYIYLGKIEKNFGITPEIIGAVENGGNVGKISGGLDAAKPTTGNKTNDLYLASDTYTIYSWTGSAWKVFLSLQFDKLLNYEKYCVNRDEVAYSGKDKILRLDAVTGKGNIDITGSPERLINLEIDVQELKDGDTFVYNAQKNKIVNLPKDEIKKTDLTVSGEAGKIVKVHSDGKIHATLEGSASRIDNIKVNAKGIKNSQVLAYSDGEFVPVNKDTFVESDTTTTGEIGKLVRVHEDGTIHGSFYLSDEQATTSGEAKKFVKVANDGQIYGKFNGTTTQIGTIKLQISNLRDGDVFVYHQATNVIKNEPKSAVGQGKSLAITDGTRVLGEYNGANPVTIDIANVVANSQVSYINHLLRLVENLYLALSVAGLNPGGYDGAIWSAYSPADSAIEGIDVTNVPILRIVKTDDSIDVDSIETLNIGEHYRVVEGELIEDVQIANIIPVYSGGMSLNRVILTKPIENVFTLGRARLIRSNFAVSDEGKITGENIILLSKPVEFSVKRTRAHLMIKHAVAGNPNITAEVSFRNSYLDTEAFKPMTKSAFYLDQGNTARATTEFTFAAGNCNCGNTNCTCGAGGGMIATIRIKATGSPVVIDSFGAVFNE